MISLHYYGVLSKYDQQFITKSELFGITRNTELYIYFTNKTYKKEELLSIL